MSSGYRVSRHGELSHATLTVPLHDPLKIRFRARLFRRLTFRRGTCLPGLFMAETNGHQTVRCGTFVTATFGRCTPLVRNHVKVINKTEQAPGSTGRCPIARLGIGTL